MRPQLRWQSNNNHIKDRISEAPKCVNGERGVSVVSLFIISDSRRAHSSKHSLGWDVIVAALPASRLVAMAARSLARMAALFSNG